jgi:multiple sugar transport system permease protein
MSTDPLGSAPTADGRSKPVQASLYAAIVLAAAATVLPFVWVVSASLRTTADIRHDPGAWIPSSLTFNNFVRLFRLENFSTYLTNSVIVAALVVAGNVVGASGAGYALAKLDFRGKRLVFASVMVAVMVPFTATFVPQFVVTVNLRLIDTRLGMALPWMVLPICIFIMRQYAMTIPDELIEAARIDGASEVGIFLRIFLPLAGPAIATITIMSFLFAWNNLLWPLVIAQSDTSYTLPVGLASTSQAANHTTDYGLVLAGAVVVMLPVLLVFLLLQRYFVRGVAATGLR